ncbi:MAG: nucleoside recognition domain-containing protein [Cyanophyceae cyanobacterium]
MTAALVVAAYSGNMKTITEASFDSARSAVELAIGLIGTMALWLGLLRVAEAAGMMAAIARAIKPIMVRLFPEVPAEHPAMSAIIMNISANALGLGNAATPMGLKAMKELDRLNPSKGTATDAMCLFLAINTSSVTLLPIEVITVRASAGSDNPAAIVLPSLVATACSTAAAIAGAKWMASRRKSPVATVEANETDDTTEILEESNASAGLVGNRPGWVGNVIFGGLIVAFLGALVLQLSRRGLPYVFSLAGFASVSNWLIPMVVCGFLLFGYFRGVRVYEALTEGAKEGFEIAVRVIPFMVAIFVAIGMFRASTALDLLVTVLSPVTNLIGMPAEALPMALIRPLSGSGAFGVMSEIVNTDPNSFLANLVSTMQGSTDTTFYVLAVYFGSVGILRSGYAVPVGLFADGVGIVASLIVCHAVF